MDQGRGEHVSDLLIALLGAGALGASWAVVGALRDWQSFAPALGVGLILGLVMRAIARGGVSAGLIGALATLFASVYAAALIASIHLAAELGLGMLDVIRTNGFRGAWSFAKLALHSRDVPWIAGGAALAFVIASMRRRNHPAAAVVP